MRHLERQILLQIIDYRWSEHLYEMDYLREGIHLRGFAQIDPLVAYKNEGFTMFHELMNSIWEEFARVIYHVEVNVEPADFEPEPARRRRSFSTRAAGPSSPPRSARPRRAAAAAGSAAGGRRAPAVAGRPGDGGGNGQARPRTRRRWSRPIATRSAATIPAGAARARSTRSAMALAGLGFRHDASASITAATPPAPSSKPSTTRTCDALVGVLDPEVELQTSRGILIGHDEARLWATRKAAGDLRQRLVLDAIRIVGRHEIGFAHASGSGARVEMSPTRRT